MVMNVSVVLCQGIILQLKLVVYLSLQFLSTNSMPPSDPNQGVTLLDSFTGTVSLCWDYIGIPKIALSTIGWETWPDQVQ